MLVCRVVVEENISVLLTNNFIDAVLTCNIASVKTFMSNCMQGYSLRFKINLVRHVHLGLRFGVFFSHKQKDTLSEKNTFWHYSFSVKSFSTGPFQTRKNFNKFDL